MTSTVLGEVPALTSAHIILGSSLNVPTDTAVSGDITISNAGVPSYSGNNFLVATKALSSANITGMFVTPVDVGISAPGANSWICIQSAVICYSFSVAAYTGGGLIRLQYGNGAISALTQMSGTWPATTFTAAADATGNCVSPSGENYSTQPTSNVTDVANQLIYITNATAAFAGGSGTANLYVFYSIFPTT